MASPHETEPAGDEPSSLSLGGSLSNAPPSQPVPNKSFSYAQQNPSCDLQLPLGASRTEAKPVETQEQIAYFPSGQTVPRVHRPVATQPDQAGLPLPLPLQNSVYQGSTLGLMSTHQLCGFSPFGFPADPSVQVGRPPSVPQLTSIPSAQAPQRQVNIGVTIPLKAVTAVTPPVASITNPSNVMDVGHNTNDLRDKGVDNALVVTINDRKVRLSNSGSDSLYTLCRCWVRNDVPRKEQTVLWDSVRLLPRPLPAALAESNEEKSTGDAKEDEQEAETCLELEAPIENISDQELLQTHVKRAKRVRARLRDERMQRIGRFKQRLALLLPPSMEQNKSDSAVAS